MEFIIIIVIVVIVSLLSAASKKKPQQGSEETPTRPSLSDIQRAFMMSNEMDTSQRAPETRPVYPVSQPTFQPAASEQDDVAVRMAKSASAFQAANRYASIDLSTFHTDSAEISDMPKKIVKPAKNSLKLFEDKSDFVRAVIYSEILTRKSH